MPLRFVVVDGATLISGSLNWTHAAVERGAGVAHGHVTCDSKMHHETLAQQLIAKAMRMRRYAGGTGRDFGRDMKGYLDTCLSGQALCIV